MLSNDLGMLSSAEVANLLGDVEACYPREILKFTWNCYFQPFSRQYLDLKYNRAYEYFYYVYV